MEINKEKYTDYLYQYILHCGIDIQKDNQMRCPNFHAHKNNDNFFSAHFYGNNKKPIIKCFSCGWSGDIYDLAGMIHNESDFIKQYEIINNIFGNGTIEIDAQYSKSANKKPTEQKSVETISVPREHAQRIFSRAEVDKCRQYSKFDLIKHGKITGVWHYTDENNNIIAMDVRFENEQQKKIVQTYWYDGRRLCSWGRLNLIYNLYESLHGTGKDKPILIHEGAKCANIGKMNLKMMTSISYNRGVENADKIDWTIYQGRDVYILQDNDLPGRSASEKIKKILPDSVILSTIYLKFNVLNKGADIEDLLNAEITPGEIQEYILK